MRGLAQYVCERERERDRWGLGHGNGNGEWKMVVWFWIGNGMYWENRLFWGFPAARNFLQSWCGVVDVAEACGYSRGPVA